MDNLPAHQVTGVRLAIERAGATLLYLPPYSPDFNPIEMAFSKLKASSGRLRREPSTIHGTSSPDHSTNSPPPNAKIIRSRRI